MVRAKDVPLTIRDLEMRGRMQAQILPLYLNVLIKQFGIRGFFVSFVMTETMGICQYLRGLRRLTIRLLHLQWDTVLVRASATRYGVQKIPVLKLYGEFCWCTETSSDSLGCRRKLLLNCSPIIVLSQGMSQFEESLFYLPFSPASLIKCRYMSYTAV